MLFLLLASVIVINILTLYAIFKTHSNSRFDMVLGYAVGILLFHSLYAFGARYFFADMPFVDHGAPFGLVYGPLLYFLAFSNTEERLIRKNVFLHFCPFVLATLSYIVFLFASDLREGYAIYNLGILYSGKVISMIAYVIYVFLNQKKITSDGRFRKLINSGATWLLLVASLFASIIVTRILKQQDIGSTLPGVIVYGAMLFVSLLIFKYCVDGLKLYRTTEDESPEIKTQPELKQYQKSALTDQILSEYEQKLNELMKSEQIFLDTELSLESLSKKVKIPKHHLTQLFNMKINRTFYQYINAYRIDYSCRLLLDEREINLEEIAFKSGFNSKVTFNRYFKTMMECTPSEYRKQ